MTFMGYRYQGREEKQTMTFIAIIVFAYVGPVCFAYAVS